MRNLFQRTIMFILLIGLMGCLETAKKTDKNKDLSDDSSQPISESKKDIVISSARLESDTIIFVGSNLENVTNLSIKKDRTEFPLRIESKSKETITAKAKSGLALAAGIIYSLSINTAKAESTVPITISVTLPNLAVNATCTNANQDQLNFAGYTNLTSANIGGLKGGNELCETSYPGSHWASMEEIMTLGAKYPWTASVWVRDLTLISDANRSLSSYCNMFKTSFTGSGTGCAANPEIYVGPGDSSAPTLLQSGSMTYICCNATRRLACVK